jgi:HSP20 family protein
MSALTKWNPLKAASELETFSPLTRWNPFEEMERMHRDLDRMFNGWRSIVPHGEEAMTITELSPAVDIIEDEKEYIVKAEMPELKKEDVKVMVEHDTLTIRGERKAEKEEKGKNFHRIERSYGSFLRSFTLPEGTDPAKIRSEYKDGLLTVHLPKSPEAKAKSKAIDIKVE